MATLQKVFSDIDFTFTRVPVIGDVAVSYDQQAVIRSIRNLLLTNHFERLWNPKMGANLTALLFENASPTMSIAIQNEITNVINNYEPRAKLESISVSVNDDHNSYNATIVFYIVNQAIPTTITVLLERNR